MGLGDVVTFMGEELSFIFMAISVALADLTLADFPASHLVTGALKAA